MPLFPVVLRRALAKSELSQREFARRVGTSSATVNYALKGTHVPRMSKAAKWVEALGLRGEEARAFIEAMALANSPPEARALVARLRRTQR